MSFWTGVKNFFSGIGRAVSSVLQNSPLMQKLLPIIGVAIPPPFDAIAIIAVEVISACMGINEGKGENPEELGWQMNEADKKPEDFGSFEEYKKYLDENYPFDKEAFDNLSEEQKTACRYVGIAGTMEEIKQAKGFEMGPTALGILARGLADFKWDDATMKAFVGGMSNSLIKDFGLADSTSALAGFAGGKLDADDSSKVSDAVGAGVRESGAEQAVETICDSLKENYPENV